MTIEVVMNQQFNCTRITKDFQPKIDLKLVHNLHCTLVMIYIVTVLYARLKIRTYYVNTHGGLCPLSMSNSLYGISMKLGHNA